MTGVDRRTFLKGVGIASAASVASSSAFASSAAPGLTLPARALTWKRTPCRLCGVGCGLLAGIEGGRAVAVKGDPDSPVSAGLACVKGYNSVQALYGRDRLKQAMVRREGKLAPVPIHQAYDLVAQQIKETIRVHGKDSVAMYGSAQWTIADSYIASKLFKGGLGTNNLDTSARLYAGSVSAGLRSSFGSDGALGCYEDIDHADTFVLWDMNLAETDPVLFSRMLARKRANPAVRIIALVHPDGPHRVRLRSGPPLCASLIPADRQRHLPGNRGSRLGRPGVSRSARRLQARQDRPRERRRRGPPDAWTPRSTRPGPTTSTFLADYTPERVQAVSGLSAAKIRWLASLYGDPTRRVMSVWGRSVNQDVRGTWTNNALYNIHLLVGKLGEPGNSAFAITGQPSNGSAPARRWHADRYAAPWSCGRRGRPSPCRRDLGSPSRAHRSLAGRPAPLDVPAAGAG